MQFLNLSRGWASRFKRIFIILSITKWTIACYKKYFCLRSAVCWNSKFVSLFAQRAFLIISKRYCRCSSSNHGKTPKNIIVFQKGFPGYSLKAHKAAHMLKLIGMVVALWDFGLWPRITFGNICSVSERETVWKMRICFFEYSSRTSMTRDLSRILS